MPLPFGKSSGGGDSGSGGGNGGGSQLSGVSGQKLVEENRVLAEELHSFVDAVRAAEGAMEHVAALSQTFSAHVAAQAEQIEELCAPSCRAAAAANVLCRGAR
jgi:hypothetical protein